MPDMQTQPRIEEQVATAVDADGNLRWPTLSRECRCPTYKDDGSIAGWDCSVCLDHRQHGPWCIACPNGSGRVPDVTLEKINAIVHDMGLEIRYYREPANMIGPTPVRQWADIGDDDRCWNRKGVGFGATDREAACSALLET